MKNAIHTATFMLCLNAAVAFGYQGAWRSWNTNAWPSYDNPRWSNTNLLHEVEVYALRSVLTVTVTLDAGGFINYATNGWVYDSSKEITFFGFGDHPYKFGVAAGQGTSNKVVVVQEWLSGIRYNYPQYLSVNTTNVLTGGGFADLGTIGEYQTNITVGVVTTLLMNASQVRALDAHWALTERVAAYTFGQYSISNLPFAVELTPRFYRNEYDNVVEAKRVAALILEDGEGSKPTWTGWLQTNTASATDYSGAYTTNGGFSPLTTQTLHLAVSGCPSNVLSWTPRRGLAGNGIGFTRVWTNTFTIADPISLTSTVVRTAVDLWGGEHSITGTYGNTFTIVVTNENIAPGFTHLDYGWKHLDKVIASIRHYCLVEEIAVSSYPDWLYRYETNNFQYREGEGDSEAAAIADLGSWLAGQPGDEDDWGPNSYSKVSAYPASTNYSILQSRAEATPFLAVGTNAAGWADIPTNLSWDVYVQAATNYFGSLMDFYDNGMVITQRPAIVRHQANDYAKTDFRPKAWGLSGYRYLEGDDVGDLTIEPDVDGWVSGESVYYGWMTSRYDPYTPSKAVGGWVVRWGFIY